MNIPSLLTNTLLATSLIAPSVAGAEELNLLCKNKAGNEFRLTVNPDTKTVFGQRDGAVNGNGWLARVTINNEEYKLEFLFHDGRLATEEKVDRVTGIYSYCNVAQCVSAKCEKISATPKF